jgi:hypothetical protein
MVGIIDDPMPTPRTSTPPSAGTSTPGDPAPCVLTWASP